MTGCALFFLLAHKTSRVAFYFDECVKFFPRTLNGLAMPKSAHKNAPGRGAEGFENR